MFFCKKKELIKALDILQKERCLYGGGGFCDCKYGYRGDRGYVGETSCCPELRSVVVLLGLMTEEEYNDILSREK